MKQRLLSLLLTGCMLLTLFPAQALAAGEGPVTAPGGSITSSAQPADIIEIFGGAEAVEVEEDTITLAKDVELQSVVGFMGVETNKVLDLNGHAITVAGAKDALSISSGATLLLKNSGNVEATITGGSGSNAITSSGTAHLTLSGKLALFGGTDGGNGMEIQGSGEMPSFKADAEVRFVGGAGGNGLCVSGSSVLDHGDITKGVFTPGTGGKAIVGENLAPGWMASLLKTGCFFYNEAGDRVDVTEATSITDAVTVKEIPAAQVIDSEGNATNYGDFSEALDAAGSGDTVKLMADVSNQCYIVTQTGLSIDLNGHTWTGTAEAHTLGVTAGPTTLTDSKGEGKLLGGSGQSAVSISGGSLTIAGEKPFTIQGGEGEFVHAIRMGGSTLTVTAPDVEVNGRTYGAGLCVADPGTGSTVTISGGTFSGVRGLIVGTVAANSQFTISGGSFQGSSKAISSVEAKPVASLLAQGDGETAYGFYVKDGEGKEHFLPVGPGQTSVGESNEVVTVKSYTPAVQVDWTESDVPKSAFYPNMTALQGGIGRNLKGKTITLLTDTVGRLDDVYEPFTIQGAGEARTLRREGASPAALLKMSTGSTNTKATLKNVVLDGSYTADPQSSSSLEAVVAAPEDSTRVGGLTLEEGAAVENNGYYPQPPAEPIEYPNVYPNGGVDSRGPVILKEGSAVRGNLGAAVGGLDLSNGTSVSTFDGGEVSGNLGLDVAGGVSLSYGATLDVQEGAIQNNACLMSNPGGTATGGVYLSDSGELTVSGGEITDNTGLGVGGVYLEGAGSAFDSCTLTMTGGSITGNRAAMPDLSHWAGQPYGCFDPDELAALEEAAPGLAKAGGVGVGPYGQVFLSGPVRITGNYIGAGNGTPSNLVILDEGGDSALPVVVTGLLTGGTGSIGVSLKAFVEDGESGGFTLSPATGTVVRGATAEEMTALNGGVSTGAYGLTDMDLAAFTSDDPDYELEWGMDENQAKVIRLIPRGVAVVVETKVYYNNLPAAVEAAQAGDTVRLIQDATLVGTLAVAKELTLDLNGHTVTGAEGWDAIKVEENGHLTLHDETGTGLVQGTGIGSGITIVTDGKLTLSGKVHVQGLNGAICYGVIALAPGAWPTLEGDLGSGNAANFGGSGLIFGNGCDAAKSFPLSGGTYRGKTASIKSGSGVVFNQVPSGPVFTGGRFIAGDDSAGGTAGKAVEIGGSGGAVSNVIPNYCYFAEDNGDGAPNSTPITGELTGDVWVVRSGGPVHNAEELQTALGGPEYASRSGNTVTLLQNVDLYGPLWFEGGTMTLDLGEFVLTGTKALVKRDNPAGEGKITLSAPALELVRDTDLTITGDGGGIDCPAIEGSSTSAPAGHSGVVVGAGCTLTLAGTPAILGGDFNVPQTGGGAAVAGAGVYVAGGTLRVPGQPKLYGGNAKVGTSQTPAQGGCGLLLQGAKVEGPIAGGEYYGGVGYLNGNQAHDYDGPGLSSLGTDLTITGGDYSGGSGLLCGTDGTVRVEGGEFTGGSAEGAGASMVPGVFGTNGGLTLAGGKFTFSENCTAALRVSNEVDLTADGLLADGCFYYDDNWAKLDGQTGKTVDETVNVARAFWEDHADTSWYQESQDAFTLTTPAQLAGLAKLTNDEDKSFTGKTVTLGADLDLSDYDWKPIGMDTGAAFDGLFDGQGHAVTGMVIDRTVRFLNNGLFQTVTGSIRNLTLAGRIPKRGNMNGGLVFVLSSGGAVENCAVFLESGGMRCGGVAGQVDAGAVLRNCYAAGNLTGEDSKAVVCVVEDDATVEDCYYRDDMPADENAQALAGDYMRSPAFADDLNAWVDDANEAAGKELYVKWQGHDGDYPDFQTASTGGDSGSTGGSGSTTPGKTETNPDGSKTTTVTDKKTGTVTETTQGENGVETVVETKKDGTVTAKVTVPEQAVQPPETGGLPVIEIPGSLPLGEGGPTQAGTGEGNGGTAPQGGPAVQIDLPETDTPVIVSLPVTDGTVVLQVAADGTETPVPLSLVEDGRAYVILDQGATLKVETREGYFDDTTGTPAEGPADFGAARNLWEGTGERQFSPEMGMNRAMLAVVLWRLDGAESLGEAVPYGDVDQDAWYASAAAWGTKSGVVQGTGAGFAPDVALTTEQMIVMLYRYTTYADLLVPPVGDGDGAEMPEGASSWAYEAIQWAINAGLLELGEDGDLTAPINRAEASAIMQSYVQYLVKR